jgi:ATPase subunit of ABC transporter with duplicated ATPase domains
MTILRLTDIHKSYGPTAVLSGFDCHLSEGERVAMIGANGAGKSTVFRIVAGIETPDAGQVQIAGNVRVGHFSQMIDLDPDRRVLETARSGLDYIHDLGRRIEETTQQLAEATDKREIDRVGRLHDRLVHEFERHDGYNADVRVETILTKFGLERKDFERRVGEFSGGWQKRIALSRLLVSEPDLLLLDEPTNHLDADTVEWLEGMLSSYRGTLLIVTHDRYFLDNVVTRIVELEFGRAARYEGGYTDYLAEKARRIEAGRKAYERQQELIAHERDFIARNMAGQKTKQAQSRQKRLGKMERVEKPREMESFNAAFKPSKRLGELVIETRNLHKAFDRELLGGLSLTLGRQERLGIIGPNGCGKSTLVSILIGKLAPDRGEVRRGSNTRIAYHDQDYGELNPEATLFDVIRSAYPAQTDKVKQKVLGVLGSFLFPEERADDTVMTLSGGEKARLLLARMTVTEPNLLVFDEPTNNLDIASIRVLEEAIGAFPGAAIVVTHDRFFLDRVATSILSFEGHEFPKLYPGNYSIYRYQKRQREIEREAEAARVSAAKPSAKAQPKSEPSRKPNVNRGRVRKEIEKLESRIEKAEARLQDLTDRMTALGERGDTEALRELGFEYKEAEEKLAELYARWEYQAGLLEEASG